MAPKKNPADQPSLIATFKLFFSSQQQPLQRQMCFFYKRALFVQPSQSKLYFNSIRKSRIRGDRLFVIGYFVKPQLIFKVLFCEKNILCHFKVHSANSGAKFTIYVFHYFILLLLCYECRKSSTQRYFYVKRSSFDETYV